MEKESISQWMDAEEVRALAESLLKPLPDGGREAAELDYGEDFVGFAEIPEGEKPDASAEAARRSLSEAQQKASSAGVIPSATSRAESLKQVLKSRPEKESFPQPSKVVYVSKTTDRNPYPGKTRVESPFTIAPNQVMPPVPGGQVAGVRSDALYSFGRWLMKNIPTDTYFVCNPDGRIAIDEIHSDKLIGVARNLVSEANDGGSSHHVKIAKGKVLEVIEVRAERGTSILGIVVPRPLSESAVAAVSNALIKALAKP
mgnify:CR=1 FL=1